MAAIRVGIIGLSVTAKTSWASSAHLPYLRASKGKYNLVAVCNSTVASARSAIEKFDLPRTTRAYGNPQDLANDEEVDLVVCCTRVDVHHEAIRPSIESGKNVYVEWPLGANLKEAQELSALAKEKGIKTVVGLQGRVSPFVQRIKSVVEEGRIGKILSSSITACGGSSTRDSLPERLGYFTQKSVGGNMVTIGFGHLIDSVIFVLGEPSSFNAQVGIKRPIVNLIGEDGKVTETVTSDVPDHISLHGTLTSGAILSVQFRRGQPFKDSPGLVWYIHGEKGEIRITASGPAIQVGRDPKIEVHDFAKDEIESVSWESDDDLPLMARNVARMYEAFASGDERQYPDFEDAVVRHQMMEDLYRCARN